MASRKYSENYLLCEMAECRGMEVNAYIYDQLQGLREYYDAACTCCSCVFTEGEVPYTDHNYDFDYDCPVCGAPTVYSSLELIKRNLARRRQ